MSPRVCTLWYTRFLARTSKDFSCCFAFFGVQKIDAVIQSRAQLEGPVRGK